jgi:hypothetical protein
MWLSNASFWVALTWGRRTQNANQQFPAIVSLCVWLMSSPPSHNALQNHASKYLLYTSTKKQTLSGGSVMCRNLSCFFNDFLMIFFFFFFLGFWLLSSSKDQFNYCFKFHFFKISKQGVCDTVALPFTLKSISRQKKKNYANSNIFTMQKIYFSKIL